MGADSRDLDNDGRPDLPDPGMVNDSVPALSKPGRLGSPSTDVRSQRLARGRHPPFDGLEPGVYDLDNDGWKDIFFAASHFPNLERFLGPLPELPNVLHTPWRGPVPGCVGDAGEGLARLHHGAGFADFDNDGKVHVGDSVLNAPARLFQNVTRAGITGSPSARREQTAAGLVAESGCPPRRTEPLKSRHHQRGYACSTEAIVRFGLGTETRARARRDPLARRNTVKSYTEVAAEVRCWWWRNLSRQPRVGATRALRLS